MVRDTDVEAHGTSLAGHNILLGVTGGIAAVESVKIARELRRHGAQLSVCMTHSAQRIITPLALRWATAGEVITDWDGDMSQLDSFDAILVTPTTRHTLAAHAHGMMPSPLLMALSAARGRGSPIMFVPSMHGDLAQDPVTDDVVEMVREQGAHVHWGPEIEGKRKQPGPVEIVSEFSHFVNSFKQDRRNVVITLGATKSSIDDVRFVQNTSTGKTGWAIATDLHRNGHDVTVVAGETSCEPDSPLPLVIHSSDPVVMLAELKSLAKDEIDAWVHSAAVLDYIVEEPIEGKVASLQGDWAVSLSEAEKHIKVLSPMLNGATRIGFKLECGVKIHDLIHRAIAQIENSGMTAVIANRLEDMSNPDKPRAHLVDGNGEHWALQDEADVVKAIRTLVERGAQ